MPRAAILVSATRIVSSGWDQDKRASTVVSHFCNRWYLLFFQNSEDVQKARRLCFEEFLLQPQPELSIRRTGQADHNFAPENDFRFGMACVEPSLFGGEGAVIHRLVW